MKLFGGRHGKGKKSAVAHGDTFTIRDGEENYKIRLLGIDIPEKGQDYGAKSTKVLNNLIHRKTVRVRWTEKDHHGRILGNVFEGKIWINHALVKGGWAWHFTKYSDDPDLAEAEHLARIRKRGLWDDPNEPLAP